MTVLQTYGRLKHGLMQKGVFIPSDLLNRKEFSSILTPNKAEENITLAFCDEFFVKTFVTPDKDADAKVSLRNGNLMLKSERFMVEVDVVPTPSFLLKHRENRDPVSQNVDLDGVCLNVFLRIVRDSKLNLSQESVVSVIQSAFEESAADLVQLNLDFCDTDDRGFFKLTPLIEDIRKKFNAFVALRGFPPRNLRVIDSIYASGIDLLNFPLEGFTHSERLSNISKEVLAALDYAVGVFPQGAVSSEIAFDSLDKMEEKINRLASIGAIPLVKLPRDFQKYSAQFNSVEEIAQQLTVSAQKHKLNLKWLYPSSELLTPLDAAFFTEDPQKARLAVRPHYHSLLGRKASEGFTALRRKLRVKNISDSFESAGL